MADDFARANEEALAFTHSCSDEQWVLPVPGEDWPVGVVLDHIAESHAHGLQWVQDMASGRGVLETAEDIDRENAAHAVRAQGARRADTAALLARNGSGLEEALRRLSDEDLDRTSSFGPAGGRLFPTEQLAAVAARHTREHLAHAQDAVTAGS